MITLSKKMAISNKSLTDIDETGNYINKTLVFLTSGQYAALLNKRKDNENTIINRSEQYEIINKNFDDKVVLFFDIDFKTETEIKDEEKISFFKNNIEYLIYLIKKFIEINNEYCIYSSDEKIDILKYKWTYSTDPLKYSYHIFFYNIHTTLPTIKIFGNFIKHYIKNSNNDLIKNIDIQVYNNLKLRIPYSKKSNGIYYHRIEDGSKVNLSKLKITTENKDVLFIDTKDVDNVSDFREISLNNNLYKLILYTLENFFNCFINLESIKTNIIKENLFCFSFRLVDDPGCGCKKKKHKNMFYLVFNHEIKSKNEVVNNIVKLTKLGNPFSCDKILEFNQHTIYKTINQYTCDNIFHLYKYIIISEDNELYFWNSQECKWVIPNNTFKIKHFILNLNEYFHNLINKENVNNMEDIIKSSMLNKKKIILDDNPYILGFKNGVYDIINSTFISGDESRFYYNTMSVGYDYVDEKNLEDYDFKIFDDKYNELKNIINQIKPKEDEDRVVFEQILGSSIIGKNKNMLAFFIGKTCAGKSTIINILQSCLGDYFHKSEDQMMSFVDSSTKPSPSNSKINNKRIISISEFQGKIQSSVVKKITENTINARDLYSNKTTQKNKSIYIIDSNKDPKFIDIDAAMCRRITVVKFNSFFVIRSSVTLGSEIGRKITSKAKNDLSNKIKNGYFSLVSFKYLLSLYHKRFRNIKGEDLEIDSILSFENLIVMKQILEHISIETSQDFEESDIKNEVFKNNYKFKESLGPYISRQRLLNNIRSRYLSKYPESMIREVEFLIENIYPEEFIPRILKKDIIVKNK